MHSGPGLSAMVTGDLLYIKMKEISIAVTSDLIFHFYLTLFTDEWRKQNVASDSSQEQALTLRQMVEGVSFLGALGGK